MRFLDWIDTINAVWGIVCLLMGLSISKFRKWHKKHQIKKVLLLQRTSDICFVSIPKFRNKILDRERDIVISNEVTLMIDICSLLKNVDISISSDPSGRDILCDEIQIGGPVSNEYTNLYFNYYLKNIKWIVTQEHLNRYCAYFVDRVKIGKLNYYPSDIGWAQFGREAEAACREMGPDYYIKDGLRAEMEQ